MNYRRILTEINKNSFSIRLKRLRKKHNMTQCALAEELNLPPLWISKYETGRSQPSIEVIVKIARYFCVSSDYLLGLSDTQ